MNPSEPLISVIVPVYNAEAFLGPALESILAQTYRSFEILVIDDGSKDGSARIARSFSPIRYFYQANSGVASARNKGLEMSAGSYIAFLDADDVWKPQKLERQMRHLLAHPSLSFVVSPMQNFLTPGLKGESWMPAESFEKNPLGIPGFLGRKEIFERVGLFNVTYKVGEDMDWLMRVKEKGIHGASLEEVLALRRIHGANLSRNLADQKTAMMRALNDSLKRKRSQSS